MQCSECSAVWCSAMQRRVRHAGTQALRHSSRGRRAQLCLATGLQAASSQACAAVGVEPCLKLLRGALQLSGCLAVWLAVWLSSCLAVCLAVWLSGRVAVWPCTASGASGASGAVPPETHDGNSAAQCSASSLHVAARRRRRSSLGCVHCSRPAIPAPCIIDSSAPGSSSQLR